MSALLHHLARRWRVGRRLCGLLLCAWWCALRALAGQPSLRRRRVREVFDPVSPRGLTFEPLKRPLWRNRP